MAITLLEIVGGSTLAGGWTRFWFLSQCNPHSHEVQSWHLPVALGSPCYLFLAAGNTNAIHLGTINILVVLAFGVYLERTSLIP